MKKRYLLFFFLALLALVSCKIDPVNTYKIEINTSDGSAPYTQMVLGESVFNLPSVSPKDGNIFLGWYKDDTLLVGKSIFVDKDIALEGKWYTPKNQAIRYLVWVQGKKQRIKTKYVSLQISEGKINLDELKAKAKEMGINIILD